MTDSWAELDAAERLAIALAVARRRGRAWVRQFDNVVSIAAGWRLRGPHNALVDDICICFLVRRKWSDRRQRPQKIPDFVTARPLVRGRRLQVRIPTDVSLFGGGQPHGLTNLSDGITARLNGQPLERGAACCLVQDAQDSNVRYLLSCNHVFSPGLARGVAAGSDCVAHDNTPLGPQTDAASPDGRDALDAALVRLDNPAVQDIALWGVAITGRATDFDLAQLPHRGPLRVLGRRLVPGPGNTVLAVRDRPVDASFRAVIATPTEFDYSATAGRNFVFTDVIQYIAETRPGDSGAPLVDLSGMVYGMHFYGEGGFGYAMAAPRLFRSGVFGRGIVL